jgi:hypothetical protein
LGLQPKQSVTGITSQKIIFGVVPLDMIVFTHAHLVHTMDGDMLQEAVETFLDFRLELIECVSHFPRSRTSSQAALQAIPSKRQFI